MQSDKPESKETVAQRMSSIDAEQTAQPTLEECIKLASKVSLTLSDWGVLTGVRQPKFGMYEISASGVKPCDEVVDDEEVAILTFPCPPQDLIAFVDRADIGGRHFDVPDAFRHAAEETATFIAWHDATLSARFWMNQPWIWPAEAATLLCRQDPGDATCDAMEISTDETNPTDFYLLRRAFEGGERIQPGNRSLCDWLDLARSQGLKYHSWIDKYIEATGSFQEDQAQQQGEAEPTEQPAGTENAPAVEDASADHEATLAALLDPVAVPQLEAMFPAGGKWGSYAERAPRNGLKSARVGRAMFNPYLAARWWMDKQSPAGWTWERCLKRLANNLPSRSRDLKHLLTGDFD